MEPTLMTPYLDYLCEDPVFKYGDTLRSWGLGLPASGWAATQTRLRNLAMLTGILYRSPKDLCKSTEFCPLFAVPTERSALVVPDLQWTVLALFLSHQSLGHKVLGKWKQIWESTFHRWLQPSPFFPSPWPVKRQTHSKFFAFEI